MRAGIMQPYIFPYIGYFQLIHAVDHFVFYDDVNFIKQGWINRNNILLNGSVNLFTIPLENASSFTPIKDTSLHPVKYPLWKKKFMRSVEEAYRKAPFFKEAFSVIERTLNADVTAVSALAETSVKLVCEYLQVQKNFLTSSLAFPETASLERADRLVTICKKLNANHYINPKGGMQLYSKEFFAGNGIVLNFINSGTDEPYVQIRSAEFKPSLSIIDVLMMNSPEDVRKRMENYKLV